MKKLLPLFLFLVGTGSGITAGIFLAPEEAEEVGLEIDLGVQIDDRSTEEQKAEDSEVSLNHEYVKLSNQFVVPVIEGNRVASMVVASLSLEVALGKAEEVLEYEPKLRNEFLRIFFDHANVGGFNGAFTEISNLDSLQTALTEVAQKTIGAEMISDVLIFEIARQDY